MVDSTPPFVIARSETTKQSTLHHRPSSLRGVKRRSNPQITSLLFIRRKKEFTIFLHLVIANKVKQSITTSRKYKNKKQKKSVNE